MRRARRGSKFTLRRKIWLALGTGIVSASASAGPAQSVRAGLEVIGRDWSPVLVRAQQQLAELKVEDIEGPPGRPIPLNIQVLSASAAEQLYILTGIPEGVSLNPGGDFGKFWAVNPKVMSTLALTAPPGFAGSFTVSIVRRRDGSGSVSTASASFKVTIRESVTAATAIIGDAPEEPPAAAPNAARKPNANEAAYMARGKSLLKSGDISAARAVFEYLALQGSAAGAMAMGETYDPLLLRALVIKGLEPDAEKARKWYLKAEELGGSDARGRLNELAGR